MGLIGRILGLGSTVRDVGAAVGGVAEVFVGNEAERDAAQSNEFLATVDQFGEEFAHAGAGWFNGFVNGLNRLPRPMLAFATLGLFTYAMAEPTGFSVRMQGLALVPDPLWWLLGAIVSFYFGARELHYMRRRVEPVPQPATPRVPGAAKVPVTRPPAQTSHSSATAAPAPEHVPADVQTAHEPAAAQPKPPAMAVQASIPTSNAAIEEWRRLGR